MLAESRHQFFVSKKPTAAKAIMTAIVKGMRSFIWTLAFMFLVLYAVGVFLTQCVTDYKVALESRTSASDKLQGYFGSLPETMLSLFQAVTDGQEWREMLEPLIDEISAWMALPFCMYIAFMAFALLNLEHQEQGCVENGRIW